MNRLSNIAVDERNSFRNAALVGAVGLGIGFSAVAGASCMPNNKPCLVQAPAPVTRTQAPPPHTPMQAAVPHAAGVLGSAQGVTAAQTNAHPVTQRAVTLPVAPAVGVERPMPRFSVGGVPGQPMPPAVFEFYRPAAPFTQGIHFQAARPPGGQVTLGVLFGAIAGAAIVAPATLVQYNSVPVASGSDVRQAYAAEVGRPPDTLQVVAFTAGASRAVIDRNANDFIMIKGTATVVVPIGSQAVAEEHLLLYPPGEPTPLESRKPVAMTPDGGRFEDQFSIPLDSKSPQGNYNYTLELLVNQQVMSQQTGMFQAL